MSTLFGILSRRDDYRKIPIRSEDDGGYLGVATKYEMSALDRRPLIYVFAEAVFVHTKLISGALNVNDYVVMYMYDPDPTANIRYRSEIVFEQTGLIGQKELIIRYDQNNPVNADVVVNPIPVDELFISVDKTLKKQLSTLPIFKDGTPIKGNVDSYLPISPEEELEQERRERLEQERQLERREAKRWRIALRFL